MPRVLAVGFLTVVTVSQLQGSTRSMYQDRYLLPVLVTMPVLMLAGGAAVARLGFARGRRSREMPWVPMAVLGLWMVSSSAGAFGEATARREASMLVSHDPQAQAFQRLWELRRYLEPGDGVLDLTDAHLGLVVLRGTVPVVVDALRYERNSAVVETPGVGWKRRFVLEKCLENRERSALVQWDYFYWRLGLEDRFQPFLPCVLRDLTPEAPISIRKPGGG